jgi:hypothetical protein
MKALIQIFTLVLVIVSVSCSSDKPTSISGVMYKDSKPASGIVRIFSPSDLSTLGEANLSSDGKFFVKNIPQGEWLIALTGRTGGVIGNYQYLKISSSIPKNDLVYEVTQEDPKAKALMEKSKK